MLFPLPGMLFLHGRHGEAAVVLLRTERGYREAGYLDWGLTTGMG